MRQAILIALIFVVCVSAPYVGFCQDEQVSSRKVVTKVPPQYPALARASHIGGMAKVKAHVNGDGKVESVEVLGGHPLLAQAAVTAVSQWRWEPSGQSTQETVVVKFSPE